MPSILSQYQQRRDLVYYYNKALSYWIGLLVFSVLNCIDKMSSNEVYSMTGVTDVNLLAEVGNEAELFEIYKVYLDNSYIKDWKVLKIFQDTIQKFYSDDYTQAVDSFKNSFKKFLNDYSSPDKRQKLAIEKMKNNVGALLASKPAQVAFEKRRSGGLEELYGAHTKNSVYQDKITLVDSTNIKNNAGPSTSKPQPVPPNKKRTISKPKTRSKKKTKRLEVRDIKHLPFDQKIHTLVDNLTIWRAR
ncbi:hypothetical protein CU097_015217 [Rhizopus azygosporus]|uniref:Uncharacterized protein n=1 Tax=Rhizopus azygosporus TaxID=86630 RepID=A0A367KFM4_RHIAZ|nr:hypothetical protein CU097_015217 [Rhizopus azygosporus]